MVALYVAISHTWGRWKTGGWICLPGVPWRMPHNTQFKVEDLPNLLEKLEYDFVWMDLLTIPQDELSDAMIERQKMEIARQAGIFRLAIAWLNDVCCWTETKAVLSWLCLAFLKFDGYKPPKSLFLRILSALRADPLDEYLDVLIAEIAVQANATELCPGRNRPK
jgi:hypothetical protein